MEKLRRASPPTGLKFLEIVTGDLFINKFNPISEVLLVRKGISPNRIFELSNSLGWSKAQMSIAIGISKGTLTRYKKQNILLSPIHTQNILEVAKLSDIGVNYFGNVDAWNLWLQTKKHTIQQSDSILSNGLNSWPCFY
ncbi:hypothetical protein KO505_14375 [Psychrosphaera sp. F3M07]|uniref:hypothetical protein n=1 Tax=Psychrosphaera sp. F3M07 TaxID=2841560 RepID=UPI001C09E2FD|nr:hypothetical protein [Psychrosphaera sp. F3M07]MBU2919129.1 hypothetical protein [Psychrosphaera sp. F3M07]